MEVLMSFCLLYALWELCIIRSIPRVYELLDLLSRIFWLSTLGQPIKLAENIQIVIPDLTVPFAALWQIFELGFSKCLDCRSQLVRSHVERILKFTGFLKLRCNLRRVRQSVDVIMKVRHRVLKTRVLFALARNQNCWF